jgi:hypothetical protein
MKKAVKKKVKVKKVAKTSKTPGSKFDDGKPPVTQLMRQFPRALRYISQISEFGHNKYGNTENQEEWDNWKHVPNGKYRYEQAIGRHHLYKSEEPDSESGFMHIGHTGWNALATLETILEEQEKLSNK